MVVGYGKNPPTHAQNQAASCQPEPAACDAVTSQLAPVPNPSTLYGALVEGPGFGDDLPDVSERVGGRSVFVVGGAAQRHPTPHPSPTRPPKPTTPPTQVRPLNSSRVPLENSAALAAALAGVRGAGAAWETCLQGFGVLAKDRLVCGR